MQLREHEKQTGYDSEELYFDKLNRELIKKIKEKEVAPKQDAKVIPFPAPAQKDKAKKNAA